MRQKTKKSQSGLGEQLKILVSSLSNRGINFFSSKLFLKIALAWFIIQGIYFALVIRFGLPPDENYHLTYIKFFSDHFPSPFVAHQDGYDVVQEAVKNPFFLYHYLLSFPYKLISGFGDAYIILRLLNVALGVLSLLVLVRIAAFMKVGPLVRNLTVFMLANTLMFTFLFSSISYDNFFIFLSLCSFLLLLQLLKKITTRNLLLFLTVILAGILTKINFLPVAFIVCLILTLRYIKTPSVVIKQFLASFSRSKKMNYFLIVIVSLLAIFFVQRFVYNVVTYKNFAPDCQQVRTIEDCRKSDLFARNEKVYAADHPIPAKDTIHYTKGWVALIESRTYGIFAHKDFPAANMVVIWASVILVSGLLIIVSSWRKLDKNIKILLYIIGFYALALFIENLRLYNASGRFGFAVHGRYLFCILPIIYLAWNHLIIEKIRNPLIKFSYVGISVLIFFISAFPVFIQKSTPDWYQNNKKIWINEK